MLLLLLSLGSSRIGHRSSQTVVAINLDSCSFRCGAVLMSEGYAVSSMSRHSDCLEIIVVIYTGAIQVCGSVAMTQNFILIERPRSVPWCGEQSSSTIPRERSSVVEHDQDHLPNTS